MHCKENPIYVFLSWELRGLSPNFHNYVSVSDLYFPRISPHISLQQNRQTNPFAYINLSQIYECRNWKTEHYNFVLQITVSFLGIHKWKPDFYIGFSSALHLQCGHCYRVKRRLLHYIYRCIKNCTGYFVTVTNGK